ALALALTAGRPYLDHRAEIARSAQSSGDDSQSEPESPSVRAAGNALTVAWVIANYAISIWCAYWSVAVVGASLGGDFSSNMKDAALWALIGLVLGVIPFG